jgi:GT2 family glycosyltransferase
MSSAPLVRVVVVNYEGGDLTITSLQSVLATDWPRDRLEVVLVDNASHDGVADRVERDLVGVRVIRGLTNRGFAGGCNLGLADLGAVEHVALLNNDATVDPTWLRPLAEVLDTDPPLGAACPKILFAGTFHELRIESPTARRGRGDQRALGLRVSGAQVDGADVWTETQLVRGFWGEEPPPSGGSPGQWTTDRALLRLPSGATAGARAALRLEALRPVRISVRSGDRVAELDVGPAPVWCDVPLDGPALTIVNNVGSVLTDDGHGADRGYLEPDDGRYGASEDVFAWCGAAVLLRRAYLDDIGLFDERLFLYYEDLELAWRGTERGWRYRYVPASVVHHRHAATSIEGSPLKHHYNERNRLLVLARHGPGRQARRAPLRFLASSLSYARRDIVSRLLRGEVPRGSIVGRRLHALGAFVVRAPGMVRSRRRDRRTVRSAALPGPP